MKHQLIYPFGQALCEKCGLPVEDETEACMFGFLPDGFTGEPRERRVRRSRRDRRTDKPFVEA